MWTSLQAQNDSCMYPIADSDEENLHLEAFTRTQLTDRFTINRSIITRKLQELKRAVEIEAGSNMGSIGVLLEPKNSLWNFLMKDIQFMEEKIKNSSPFYEFLLTTNVTVVSPITNGYFCVLPHEIMLHIFSFMTLIDLSICIRVCKEWKELGLEDNFYKKFCEEKGFDQILSKPDSKSWRWLCRSNMTKFIPKKEGCGSYIYPEDKGAYIGDWKNDSKHGYGKFMWNDGSVYEGEWQEDKRDGFGTMRWQDGQTYTGTWKNSRKEGYGEETWPDGRKYLGEYKNSNMHGFGTYIWPGGDLYVGQWKDDNIHGKGTYTWHNGSKYEGEWICDEHNGYGSYTCPGGESYEGYWLKNQRNGKGYERWSSGHSYSGEWKENKKHGKGIFTWPDGDFYSGEWKEGKRFGKGLLVTLDQVYFQEWKCGETIIDESDKGLNNSVLLGSRREFEEKTEDCWQVENVLKRKREFSEVYLSYQAKKSKIQ